MAKDLPQSGQGTRVAAGRAGGTAKTGALLAAGTGAAKAGGRTTGAAGTGTTAGGAAGRWMRGGEGRPSYCGRGAAEVAAAAGDAEGGTTPKPTVGNDRGGKGENDGLATNAGLVRAAWAVPRRLRMCQSDGGS